MNGETKNTCENCRFCFSGENLYALTPSKWLECHNPKLVADGKQHRVEEDSVCGDDELFFPYDEGIEHFEVGRNFGCVHFQNK